MTKWMGWLSKIESPWLTRRLIAIWKLFASDLDLSEAKHLEFRSLQDCFIRELKDGVRPIDYREGILVSPCDAIVGACGQMEGNQLFQAKGFPYPLEDLIPDPRMQKRYRNGTYVTLRLKSSMYHRFHAPVDCKVCTVTYISGDTWNVNPIALERIEKLYCKNERAVVELEPDTGSEHEAILMVPVAAILVASMKFHCVDQPLDLKYKGPNLIPCAARYRKGEEMGYFQHGSTIIVFAPSTYQLEKNIAPGTRINMGEPLLKKGTLRDEITPFPAVQSG